MAIEYECRVLDINAFEMEERLLLLGAKKTCEYFQKRYTYDVNPLDEHKWIRLRTNGKETTLTVKHVTDNTKLDGTKEWEIEVSDFEKTNELLNNLGFNYRNYQENKRILYTFNDVELMIDTWPMIPPYLEIEGKNEKDVLEFAKLLDEETTTKDVVSVYNDYGIDILSIKELKFEE